jgi:bifunctional non-homologous end joining protein LigD
VAGLQTYQAKRDFSKTREPRGARGKSRGTAFVIQKHAARRLHYDFRLELDGVLKSWAVTKGPSLVPGEKRLAVEVEDHPIDYQDFEGTIPKGQYGGGTVLVWDRGTWVPKGDPREGLAKGRLDFELHGEKLHGLWHLVRMRGRPGEKRTNWLLIKARDDDARERGDPDILEERAESVLSGRSIEEIAADKKSKVWTSNRAQDGGAETPAAAVKKTIRAKEQTRKDEQERAPPPAPAALPDVAALKGARKAALPQFVEPCLATLEAKPPKGRQWVHEIKFDGYRLEARIDKGKVKLLTRSGLDWSDKFGERVLAALGALPVRQALIDGELVVEGEAGASDFAALQTALSEGKTDRFVYYAFDLLYADGSDLREAKLIDRKAALRALVPRSEGAIRFSEDFDTEGEIVLENACRLSLEGIVSKRSDAPYRSGRNRDWIKSKCSHRQEFVIAGYVPSSTGANAIGSLVLGVHENGKLKHVGRVGTGFSAKSARELWSLLEKRRTDKPPFGDKLSAEERRDVRWVEPELVAEVEFRSWTGGHILRHAAFRGLRGDKEANEVVREDAGVAAPPIPASASGKSFGVKLTHPDRIYWPDAGVTKQGLAEYYADVWKWMAPHVVARPLALVRCPDGISKKCFFQKAAWKGIHRSVSVLRNPGEGGDEVLAIHDLDGLIALVQGGVLEIHPWGSTVDELDRPDRIIFDLDPAPDIGWPELMRAANEVRDRLRAEGLESFIKTTGGKGVHVMAPIEPVAHWDEVKPYTRTIAEAMVADSPDRYVSKMSKKLRDGHIFIDYLRNGRGATAVAAYSTRSRPGAPVSTPLSWEELGPDVRGAHLRVDNLPTRLAHLKEDPWSGFFKLKQRLPTSQRRSAKTNKSRR